MSTATTDTSAPSPTPPPPAGGPAMSTLRAFGGLAADIGLPLVGYYAFRLAGASELVALLAAAALAVARLVWVALAARHVSWFAAATLVVFGTGFLLALVTGDPRTVLLCDSATTGALGLLFLASLATARPLTLSAFQTWRPAEAEEMAELYRTAPAARRAFRVSSLVWGLGLLAESALRVPLVLLLPVDVAVGASTGLLVTVITLLSVWNGVYAARVQARAEAAGSPAAEDPDA